MDMQPWHSHQPERIGGPSAAMGKDQGKAGPSRGAIALRRTAVSLMALVVACTVVGMGGTLSAQDMPLSAPASVTAPAPTLVKSGYAAVGDLKMYYEIHGKGAPLVLLHGGFMDTSLWGATLTALARSRQVIAFDMEGHGRTADLDRPLTWEQIADDVAAAVKTLGYQKVDVMGYSLGGVVGLRMGMRYPELVRKIVSISGLYSADGYFRDINAHWPTVEELEGSPMQQEYARVAPDPAHWPVFAGKVRQELVDFKGWPESEVRSIKAPTLIVVGDNDAIRPEYEMHLFRLLGGDKASGGMDGPLPSQLAVLPNTTHLSIFTRSDLLVPIVNPFLDAPMPE